MDYQAHLSRAAELSVLGDHSAALAHIEAAHDLEVLDAKKHATAHLHATRVHLASGSLRKAIAEAFFILVAPVGTAFFRVTGRRPG